MENYQLTEQILKDHNIKRQFEMELFDLLRDNYHTLEDIKKLCKSCEKNN